MGNCLRTLADDYVRESLILRAAVFLPLASGKMIRKRRTGFEMAFHAPFFAELEATPGTVACAENEPCGRWRMAVRIVGLAVCYYLAGQLGLFLAIPPGYATAFWPAAGIAVAGLLHFGYRVWPSVLIGSYLVNVATNLDAQTNEALFRSLALPAGLAIGAMLQALLGAVLVKRYVGYPTSLAREKDVGVLLLMVGPVSCVVNASVGTGLLWWSNRIQTGEVAFTWWTWWVGDTIGAFVVTPLVLLWTMQPRSDWPHRRLTLSLPLGVLTALVVALFVYIDGREMARMRHAFEFQTESLTRALKDRLDYALEVLNGMRNFHGNHPNAADQARFTRAARAIRARRPTVQALTWAPRVRDADRAAFEQIGRDAGMPDYAIREQDEQRQFVTAGHRSEYFPILYRFPTDTKAFGFDIHSESGRREALHRAADTGKPIAAPPIRPSAGTPAERTILVFLPIYQDGAVPDETSERREAVVGYVVAVLRFGQIVDLAWQGFDSEAIDCWLYDATTPSDKHFAYYRGATPVPTTGFPPPEPTSTPTTLQRQTTINEAGRRWTVQFLATPAYVVKHRSLQAWAVLAGGMLVIGLLGAVLLVVTGRTALVADLVHERTADLALANAALTQEIDERVRTEATLKSNQESLRQSEERFRLLVEGATDYAIFMLDPSGRVVSWTAAAARIKGYRPEEIIGQHYSCFFTDDDIRNGQPALALEAATREGRFEYEGWRVRKDGSTFWSHAMITALRDGDGNLKGFSKITRDLTERKKSEAALEESRRFTERIAEMMPSILYVIDLKAESTLFVNQRVEPILGYTPDQMKKGSQSAFLAITHPDDVAKIEWANEQYQIADDGAVIEIEFRVQDARGEWRWLHGRETIFGRDPDGNPTQILGTAQDVTDRKRLELEVLEVAASEQRRIGGELHDGVGQELTGLCMLADNLAEGLGEVAPDESQRAARIAFGLRQALGEVRALSRGLIPVEVDSEGLMAALTELASRSSELQGGPCRFSCQAPVAVDDNFTATQLFRIAQEAMTNALKHSKAKNICISLDRKGDCIALKITDDGVGLPNGKEEIPGVGMRIMRYRAGQIGAQFSVRSTAKGGTLVSCTLYRGTSDD
jgi:PAS domain S-box-containing protein